MNSLYSYSDSIEKELNENIFLSCKDCHNLPEIFLENNEYLLLECIYCEKTKREKILNLVNYPSEWISNEIFCELNHKEKNLSTIYCKTCNLFLCQNCYEIHNKDNIHDYISIDNFKLDNDLIKQDNKKIYEINGLNNFKNFGNFLENTKNIQKQKYMIVNEKLLYIEYLNGDDKDLLDKTISKILKIFYNDLKVGQFLIFLAKVIFMTCQINKNNDEIIDKYKKILDVIYNTFNENEIEEFKKSIISLKNRYEIIYNPISEKEKKEIEINIKNTFKPFDNKISDFNNTRDFIENNINLFYRNSHSIKFFEQYLEK